MPQYKILEYSDRCSRVKIPIFIFNPISHGVKEDTTKPGLGPGEHGEGGLVAMEEA